MIKIRLNVRNGVELYIYIYIHTRARARARAYVYNVALDFLH